MFNKNIVCIDDGIRELSSFTMDYAFAQDIE